MSDNRGNYHSQPPPIYTVSGAYPDGVNYGFHPAPPPKYEDAVRGIQTERLSAHGGLQPAGVILVAPAYAEEKKFSNLAFSLLLLLFSFAFLIYIFIRMRS